MLCLKRLLSDFSNTGSKSPEWLFRHGSKITFLRVKTPSDANAKPHNYEMFSCERNTSSPLNDTMQECTHSRKWLRLKCTCAPVPWKPRARAAFEVCLSAGAPLLSGCPALSSELLLCSPAPAVASPEEGHTLRHEGSH